MSIPSDEQFLIWSKKIRRSDRKSFDQLFRSVYPVLMRFAMRYTGDHAAAKDVVQDCFVKLWQRRGNIDTEKSLKSFLYSMVRNRALNLVRNQAGTDVSHDLAVDLSSSEESTELETNENSDSLQMQMKRWISELPPRQKEAFELSRFEGLDHDEISGVMGVSPKTVNNHIVAALSTLRGRYEERKQEDST